MSGGVWRRSGWLRRIRAGGAGIARLLLLAFALQLTVPTLELGGIAALAGEAAFRADLQSSLCHDPNSESAPLPDTAPGTGIKHCIFCLPMAGTSTTAPEAPLLAELALAADVIDLQVTNDQIPATARPAFARPRAPPSSPRTV
jgi:hypothetical protein